MRNRISQRGYIENGRECILEERRKQGDCTFCPANHNENTHGSKSKWGRKVAAKRLYSTGKGRKEINWFKLGPWDLQDDHYNPDKYVKPKRRLYRIMNKGQLQYGVREVGRMLHNDAHWANKLWHELKNEESIASEIDWNDDCFEYRFIIKRRRKRNNF